MSDQRFRKITTVPVGTPPDEYSYDEWTSVEVHFHGFSDLTTARGGGVESPRFTCFGRQWSLHIFPGGHEDAEDGMVSIFLTHYSSGSAEIEYGFRAITRTGKQIIESWVGDQNFGPGGGEHYCYGECDFVKRSKIIQLLSEWEETTLVIEIIVKLLEATDSPVPPFIPENPLCKHVLKKFMDEKSSDILFEVPVESDHSQPACKRAKTSPAVFHAHHLILQDSAPVLAELSAKTTSAVQITDIKPDIFRNVLYYIYGGKLTDDELKVNAKEFIEAADRYGVVNLKLEAEACYANSIKITVENVLDNLLYADAKNCALLKEVVMDFMLENDGNMIGKVSFENVPGSIVNDLLTATARGKERDDATGANYSIMRVSTLRKKLHEKGLDIDGSREAMIALLKENS